MCKHLYIHIYIYIYIYIYTYSLLDHSAHSASPSRTRAPTASPRTAARTCSQDIGSPQLHTPAPSFPAQHQYHTSPHAPHAVPRLLGRALLLRSMWQHLRHAYLGREGAERERALAFHSLQEIVLSCNFEYFQPLASLIFDKNNLPTFFCIPNLNGAHHGGPRRCKRGREQVPDAFTSTWP
jgi:hypothetical protein